MSPDGNATPEAKAVPSSAVLSWVERLIRIDTTSRKSNLGLIETVRDHLGAAGLVPRF